VVRRHADRAGAPSTPPDGRRSPRGHLYLPYPRRGFFESSSPHLQPIKPHRRSLFPTAPNCLLLDSLQFQVQFHLPFHPTAVC
jgi:hypothetical protein